jgi:hypothetical protein
VGTNDTVETVSVDMPDRLYAVHWQKHCEGNSH